MAEILTDRDPGDEKPSLRDLNVVSWRFDCLTSAGYPVEVAVSLAERQDVDLHKATGLLEHGATVEEALRILL